MIREAILFRIKDLYEAAADGADADAVEKGDPERQPKVPKQEPPPETAQEEPGQEKAPDSDDPKDDEPGPDQEDALDLDGTAAEEGSGEVNKFVSGKSVQSVTVEDQSKVLPGAKEVILSFDQTSDALRILVTPTGRVVFLFKGQMHDIP